MRATLNTLIRRFNRYYMSKVVLLAKAKIAPIIEEIGYEVVDIEYEKIYDEMNLTFYIYKKEGISLEDCEKVNNLIELPLDEIDITEGESYVLNISSPGLDRPIITKKDYERNIDTEVEIILIEPISKKKKLEGKLLSFDESTVTINHKTKQITIQKSNIKTTRPYIKF